MQAGHNSMIAWSMFNPFTFPFPPWEILPELRKRVCWSGPAGFTWAPSSSGYDPGSSRVFLHGPCLLMALVASSSDPQTIPMAHSSPFQTHNGQGITYVAQNTGHSIIPLTDLPWVIIWHDLDLNLEQLRRAWSLVWNIPGLKSTVEP